jgi:hypothetical protein
MSSDFCDVISLLISNYISLASSYKSLIALNLRCIIYSEAMSDNELEESWLEVNIN